MFACSESVKPSMPPSCLSNITRTGFHTLLCWPQVGVRGHLWLSLASLLRCKRKVCWILCSTLVEFLGPHGKNTEANKQKNESPLDSGCKKHGVKMTSLP